LRYIIITLLALLVASCEIGTRPELPELMTVSSVDLSRYAGEWYEIARYPHRFQKGCYGSKATYTLLNNGKVRVLNECRRGGPDGKWDRAEGTAWVVDRNTNAKLKVSFFWPFSGDYWIIDLGEQYEYSVVGHPSRKYLWILSRTGQMENRLYDQIIKRLQVQQFDTSRLVKASPVEVDPR
jgi:apolipoprotein D and lipocalin family protein